MTRCDRYETALSDATPGDLRDTSTPRALATGLRAYVLGNTLPADRRAVLTDLLRRNTTGDNTIRAGVPDHWQVGDKTGTGGYGTRNDIAVIWPPAPPRSPWPSSPAATPRTPNATTRSSPAPRRSRSTPSGRSGNRPSASRSVRR